MIFMDNQAIAFFTSKIKIFAVVYEPFPILGGFLTYASLRWKPTYVEAACAAAGHWLISRISNS
jgi:hypothetical protein